MSNVEADRQQDALVITLNRPQQRNAFDPQLIDDLIRILDEAQQQSTLRFLLLKGAGHHFSAGADLHWMRSMAHASAEENQADALRLAQLFRSFYEFPAPTLVKVQGTAMGGALGLIACADIVIASTDTIFALSELRLGLAPAVISPYLIRAIGSRPTQRLALSACTFDAQTALRLGLVHDLTTAPELEQRVQQEIARIRLTAPQASRACKLLLRQQTPAPSPELENHTAALIAQLRTSAEGQEGLNAFFNQQPPSWQKPS